jgi:hypothetical protein
MAATTRSRSSWREGLAAKTANPAECAAILDMAQDYVRCNGNHQYDILLGGNWEPVPGVTATLANMAKPALPWWAAKEQLREDIETAWTLVTDPVWRERAWNTVGDVVGRALFETDFKHVSGRVKAFIKTSDKARELGHEVHALIESYLRGRMGQEAPAPTVSDEALYIYSGFERWAEEVGLEPLAMEKMVCSGRHRFAGQIDCLAIIGGQLCILDWKTTKKPVESPYDEHILQNIAYRNAAEELGLPPLGGWVIYVPKYAGGEIQAFRIGADPKEGMKAFLGLRAVHVWKQGEKQ